MRVLLTYIIFSALITFKLSSQENLSFKKDSIAIGFNYQTRDSIFAKKYTFQGYTHRHKIDSLSNTITFQHREKSINGRIRTKGMLVSFDLNEGVVLWKEKHRSGAESNFTSFGKTFRISDKESIALDNLSGEKLWEIENKIYHINTQKQLILGYKIRPYPYKQSILQRININDGSVIWEREVNKEFGWQEVKLFNDTTLLIVADGLYTLNLNNGKGWKYDARLAKKDYTKTGVTNAVGIAFGALTGTYFITTGNQTLTNVCSNILVDSSYIYFASRESIIKLNVGRDTLWQQALPSDQTSSSFLFMHQGKLKMINRGFALSNGRMIRFGTPYIASFNKDNGKIDYLELAPLSERAFNNSIAQGDSNVLMVIGDQVLNFSLLSGKLISKESFKVKEYGHLDKFLEAEDYIATDTAYRSFKELDPLLTYLITSTGKILGLNANLVVEEQLNNQNIFRSSIQSPTYKVLVDQNHSIIINNDGKVIASINYAAQNTLLGGKLFGLFDDGFLVLDMPF